MDILIIILLVVVAIVGLFLIAALFVNRVYAIRREIVIRRPLQEVFDYVKLLRNQDYFSKWVMADPQMKKDFRGQDGTVGFVYAWNSNQQAGEGEQEITGIIEGRRVDVEIRFVRPFKSVAQAPIVTEPVTETQTKVIWGMEGQSRYPLNLLYAMMKGVLGKDLDKSLQLLKRNLEGHSEVQA